MVRDAGFTAAVLLGTFLPPSWMFHQDQTQNITCLNDFKIIQKLLFKQIYSKTLGLIT
jgi:hypothetical protein